tara:strand:+ start:40381 stop:40899 length:519 start_codon:yes stop_codon:yes gene_type:complete
MKLDTERMKGFGAHKVDGHNVNYLFGLNDLCIDLLSTKSSVLELGCNDGVSTSLFSKYAHKVTAVDINLTEDLNSLIKKSSNIRFEHLDIDLFFQDNTEKYDLIYIDGPHDYDSVKRHIHKSIENINEGGFICGHDYHSDFGVVQAVNDVLGNDNIKVYSDSSWAFITNDHN